MKSRTKKILFLSLKVAVSGLLLALVFRKAGIRNVLDHLGTMDLRLFFLSSLLYLCIAFIASVRWWLLLDKQYPIKRLYSLNLIGGFFSNFLPGAVGGDAVKMYYLYRNTGKGGMSVGSVFMDRYIGMLALLIIGMTSGLFAFAELAKLRMQWITPLIFAGFLGGSVLFFGVRIGRRFAAVSDFYDYFHAALRRKRLLAETFLISLAVQLISILMIYLIAAGMGQRPSFTALFVFVPIIITVMSVPISISGLGIRESAFVLLFGLTGVPAEASMSISFLWFLSIATASLVGLVEYVRYGRQKDRGRAGSDVESDLS